MRYWIRERENIRRAKTRGESKPWSLDPVFQATYFCNVHREDDRVTRWIRENYTPDLFGEFYEVAIVAARLFNWPDTLEWIKFQLIPMNYRDLHKALTILQVNKKKIWGGAYLITTHGRKMSKIDYCVETLETAHNLLPLTGRTLEECYHQLRKIPGIGSFLAAQILADLKNTKDHKLQNAEDWFSFSAPGPGSLRGLSWFHEYRVTESNYHEAIQDAAFVLDWPDCMQDLQNCFCEYDKYCRVLTGTGRSKRKYAGA